MITSLSGSQYPKYVIPLIEKAKHSIKIVVFDWRWYPQDPGASCQLFNQTLVRASRRGVKIDAIANSDNVNKILNANGINTKKLETGRLVHSKLIIIDNEIVIIGSHNFTQSAFNSNIEMSILITNDPNIQTLITFFQNLWLK